MNDERSSGLEGYRELMLLSEIERAEQLSQRDLAQRLGIALGLVNSYLKNLVAKGYVRVKAFPRNRYSYLVTPKGLVEKSRLAYQHLSYFTSLYTTTRQEYVDLFCLLKAQGIGGVVFCGVDEVAEIAYLSLQEVGMELIAVVDVEVVGRSELCGRPVMAIAEGALNNRQIIITSLKRREMLAAELIRLGVKGEYIHLAGFVPEGK